ncbi:MerR family transcriptional regulator [Phototrophicus methaneseepsis]|uniref:MerR family transcriptional regulator n=1 Tax=Phototrophicus methaneseepsis TaxID=2710758 RepID=A0A7S8ID31_9CHLR|nr:MerR family transcriptional regulator [Phototrophicus methaneseepsis]QPC82140.1 MerR family transcriptional regulator [Phototrophicus methaneseepsis]
MYTVKQLSNLANVSVRTLHYYHEIELLTPSQIGDNSYRYYDEAALLRLQQILFYRELGMELLQIKEVLDSPDFDLLAALKSHRTELEERITRLNNLVSTVDSTIRHLAGEIKMSDKKLFAAFSEEEEKQYTREARLTYGPNLVNESMQRWNSYSAEEKQAVMDEGNAIYADIAKAIDAGKMPHDSEVQDILVRWHDHLRYFYEPSIDLLAGLGQLYNSNPDFIANFQKVHPDLPQFMEDAVTKYADDLETAAIERLLAEDEELASRL